jgi:Ca2+-binding RTX toxin-like protein
MNPFSFITKKKILLFWVAMTVMFLVIASLAGRAAHAQTAPVGQGFNLNASDLRFIMQQIRISERHAATLTPSNPCGTLVGSHPDQIPVGTSQTIELPWGLRTVDGSCNHLTPGQETFGASDQVFPRSLSPEFRAAELGTSYTQLAGTVTDSQPRIISNLIVDQTISNPAAVSVSGLTGLPGETLFIPNVAPDAGLSAPFNSWFTIFGQFFDHGLDLVKKGGRGTVFIPLQPDDPLFVPGSPTNFMVLTRATHNGNFEALNSTSPWVDQSQTYASHPSHQVFLRSYTLIGGRPVGTGRLITGQKGGMATWADVKAQALTILGIQLTDADVLSVPLLATDPYGRFLRGPNGFPQIVKNTGLVEGNLTTPVDTVDAVPSGHAFLDDIAHHAVPGAGRIPDADLVAGPDDGLPGTYDNELLEAHFMAGDGRVNENIALTAVHHVFHSEHNRLTGVIVDMIANDPEFTQAERNAWQIDTTGPAGWDYGERLFQAARFVTEMQYQHLAFEEFARKVQPMVNPFGEGGTGFHPSINGAIRAEFAHAVYRFGHSMLTESVDRFHADGTPDHLSLFDAFLNPLAFDTGYATADEAAGAIVRGLTRQVANEIDEFVTEALRNRLLGLPLDLATLNMARARETGIPRLNEARWQFFLATQNSVLAPHANWIDFGFSIRNSASLVNFVAAYGTHPTITGTMAQRRAAAQAILDLNPSVADAIDFLNSTGIYGPDPVTGRTTTGVDDIDLWVGGLAEKPAVFGGLLGPTFNYVFETQMEDLQDGDRFYYLSRTAGLNLLVQLEGNSLAELIHRNTDASGLPADAFSRPAYIFNMAAQTNPTGIVDDPATPDYDERLLLIRRPDGTIRYTGLEHVVFNGSAGNDRMWASEGDDTLRGNDGNDWMDGGDGNDSLIGGDGDDILIGGFGDDNLKGGDGNDVLSSGQGFGLDLNQGGRGNDYIIGGNDATESFGGPGNDFIFAGDGDDVVFGDDGDDWIEGGRGAFNLLQGDNGAPFQNDLNAPGHDVLMGFGGEQDYDSEGGDDIMFMGPGIQRAEGMLGFDWAIHKLDPNPGDSDMLISIFLPPTVFTNRDRFDLVEGLSGWIHDDILKGDDRTSADIFPDHALNAAGIARIQGLAALLPVGATSFSGGNIILGGAGSDILEGRGGDDILDGDAWLDVQIRVIGTRPAGLAEFHNSMVTLNAAVLAGQINPGQLEIFRSIKVADFNPTHIDTAVFSGLFAEYVIVNNADGTITVIHALGTAADGTDTLRNIEVLQFADRSVSFVLSTVASGDAATTAGVTPVDINVLANDTFNGLAIPAGATVTVTRVTNAVDGNAVLNADNTFTFTANAGFSGIATFTYNVTVNGQLSNTATVSVLVNSLIANGDVATTTGTTPVIINVLANDTYLGDPIPAGATVALVANSVNGNAVLNANNTFTFTANAGFSGIATFTYNVTVTGQVSNTATVSVAVDSLIANGDVATTRGITPVNINVLANDTLFGVAIPTGATVTVALLAPAANGNAVLNANNTFTFTANPGFSGIDTFTYNVTVNGELSNTATVSVTVNPALTVPVVDFDGDGKTDIAVYRAETGAWYVIPSGGASPYGMGWGGDATDVPVPGDYDGDAKIDIAVYRRATGAWYVIPSSGGLPYGVGWGGDITDIPVPGDYDLDGKTDIAVYRKATGAWYVSPSGGASPYGLGWGGDSSDIPVPGDYDGDGKTDIAVYRKGTGAWYVSPSGGASPYGIGWGGDATDVPAPGDYDGDDKTDVAVYRVTTGAWYVIPSGGASPYGLGWGGDATDVPVPGDYDGDGKADIAVYRRATGAWYVIPSSGASPYGVGWGGDATDIPISTNPASYMSAYGLI